MAIREFQSLINWIHFTNIGDRASDHCERSSITELPQYASGIKTAAYYRRLSLVRGLSKAGGAKCRHSLRGAGGDDWCFAGPPALVEPLQHREERRHEQAPQGKSRQ